MAFATSTEHIATDMIDLSAAEDDGDIYRTLAEAEENRFGMAPSPRGLAVTLTDTAGYFVSESSVYRLLKTHDLIASPTFIVMPAASEFKDKTTAVNQMWQTDFTYLKVIGWGWMYLSSILDDFLPGDLEQQIELFVDHYNPQRYHERLKNLTLADIYYGYRQSTIAKREKIKRNTIAKRRLHYQRHAA